MPASGRLIVCATPIGNLGDVTLRVLEALREVDSIAAEDTRVTARLLARYGIETPMERFDEHVAARRTPVLIERMLGGETIALVSDAGTPGLSDPGARLLEACAAAGVRIEPLPGASALLAATVASGLPMQRVFFGGFFPRKAGERRAILEGLSHLDATLVFYESPRRTASALAALAAAMPGRQAVMARELTKIHEEVVRDEVSRLAASLSERELKGEVVLLVGPPVKDMAPAIDAAEVRGRVEAVTGTGLTRSDAIKLVARETGLARNEVYRIAHDRED